MYLQKYYINKNADYMREETKNDIRRIIRKRKTRDGKIL